MSTRVLSPTLIALACAVFGGVRLDAATASERDQHFAAIEALIAAQLRLPGERQLAEFEKAGYPDDGWHRKTLRWYFADVFKTEITDQTKAKALEGQATALRAEIEGADKGGTLPEAPKALFAGAGDATSRTVNEVGQMVKPDGVEPLVISPEAQAKVRRQVEFLVDSAGKRFAAAVAKVKANAEKEKGIWDFPDGDAKGQALIKEATFLRADALRSLYIPHIILREVVTRGRDFGLDPEPAAKMLAKVLKEHAKTIEDWDYNFGDYYPPLKMQANVLLGEAIRQQVGGEVKLEAVEAELMKLIDQKLDGLSRDAKEGVVDLQIKAWAALIKLRTELGGDRNLFKGEEFWRAWLADRGRESGMKPGANNGFSREVGGLYIAAARLLAAKGDKAGAQALLGQVVANKKQPQWHNASDWLRKLSGGGANTGSGDSWGQPVVPADPSQALVVAQALLRAAKETADAKLAQSQIQSAAIQLRAAVMGLSAGWEDQFAESGAEVYNEYARALNQLGLRIHAAIAAAEGLKAVKAKVAAAPKGANPYRTGPKQEWNEQGKKVAILARNGLVFASNLSSRLKGPGAQAMASDLFEAVKQVAPEEFGKGSEWNFIVAKLQEGDWNGAIEQAGKYRKNYPEDTVKVFGVVTSALLQKYNQARGGEDKAGMARAADEMRSFSGEIKAYIAQQKTSKAGLGAEEQRNLQKAANTIESMDIQVLMGDGKFDQVIKRLGPDYWKNPPADETLFAQMLRNLAQAVQRQERERVKDAARKADPKELIALWPTYQFAYDTYAKMLPRIKDPEEKRKARFAGKMLADLFVLDTFLAESLGKAPDAPPELAAIATAAKRGMADLLEPDMGSEEKPENLLGVGTALWDLGDHGRAVRLLELFVKKAGENAELAAFREDPKAVLDAAETTVISRPELKGDWARLRDLVEDKPGFKDEREKVERASWSEQPADFGKALQDLKKFRAKVAEMKLKMGDGYAKADAALAKLESLIGTAVRETVVSKRLAQGWRETGRIDQARDLYLKLYAQDPDDPVVATAVVDITVDQIKAGKAPDQATIVKALAISEKIRDEAGKDQYLYWTAAIQVYELNAALGTKDNLAVINKGLKYDTVNQSDPSWTLVSPRVSPDARQAGDRKDVRRAANALAVDLAKRYLALYQLPGVTQKPTYKLDAVQIDGKEQVVFVNLDSAPMTVVPAVTEDEREVFIITDEDSLKAFEKAKAAREEAERLAAASATAAAASATAAAQPAATAAQPK
jgi:hypothetical protein